MLKSLIRTLTKGKVTSVSDEGGYPRFCEKALHDERAFASFRRHPVYQEILDHVTREQGRDYLNLIERRYPHLLDHLDLFKVNDRLGGPFTHEYRGTGSISPSTLRYVKVLGDLEALFGDTREMVIAEIGGGYGGQCRLISAYLGFAAYVIVDLEQCLGLAKKYLHQLGVEGVSFQTMSHLRSDGIYDLVISNYAFTECTREVQEGYLDRVLARSARGYLTCNQIAPKKYRIHSRQELLDSLPGSHILPEEPLTHDLNCILVWGNKS